MQRMRTTSLRMLAVAVAMASGCKDDRETDGDAADDAADDDGADGSGGAESGAAMDDGDDGPTPVYLSPSDHLVRISMALRGTRPSSDELAMVHDDPEALEGIVDGYLDSPNFGETMRDLHNESLLVLADYFFYPAGYVDLPPLEGTDPYLLNRSVMEASLRLIEHVITEDRPYSEIVTADYTLANGVVAAIFGLPYEGDGASWELTEWTDGRGNAGILSDGWMFQRHSSTISNANRGRANAISRSLLCYDFAARDVELDASINLADPDEVANAVVENDACATCHQALDPLASFFRSNVPLYVPGDPMSVPSYPHPTYVQDIFPTYLGVTMRAPSYFGTPGDGMPMLGTMIAGDPRFWSCTVRRFYGYFHQTPHEDVPLQTVAGYQAAFLESGLDAKALVKAIVLADEFRISHWEAEVDDDRFGVLKARPLQLAQLVRDTTGFTWLTDMSEFGLGRVNLLEDSFIGYQVLGGGVDSVFVTRPSHTYGATTSLVAQNLAREAAHHVVEGDFAVSPGERRLLDLVEPGDSDEATIRDQIVLLHARIYAETAEPDDTSVTESWQLWSAAYEHGGDAARAWKTLIMAMLQDARVAAY